MSHQIAIDNMVRTLWVLAWADFVEEHPGSDMGRAAGNMSGVDIWEAAPPVPDFEKSEATVIAENLYKRIKTGWDGDEPWGVEPWEAVVETAEIRGRDPEEYLAKWAYRTTMEAVGHGVCWLDDEEPILGYTRLGRLVEEPHKLPQAGSRELDIYIDGLNF